MKNPLEHDLAELGRAMSPDASFARRVMQQIDAELAVKTKGRWFKPLSVSLAASFILACGLTVILRHRSPPMHVVHREEPQLVCTSTEWQTVTAQPVILSGDVPACQISKQKFQRMQWTDPQRHATFERLVPQAKVTFVTMERY